MKLGSLLQDGLDGSLSSRRVVTFSAFVFCSIAFFANLFFEKKIDANIFEGMIYIAIAGLGATAIEKFSSRTPLPQAPQQYEPPRAPINNRRPIHGTPIPRTQEREL